MCRLLAVIAVVCLSTSCTRVQNKTESWPKLAEEFVYKSLAYSPAAATQVGYHTHEGKRLDAELDDYSARSLDEQRRWLRDLRLRMTEGVKVESLDPQDRADFDIVSDQISSSLLELDTIQNYRHNPTLYVELAGNALYTPYVLEYADKPTRYRHVISRMEKLPVLMRQARANLVSAPAAWTSTAKDENTGNIELIDGEMRTACPPELRAEYDKAAGPALAALREFNTFLDGDLSRTSYPWQLGRDKYDRKFRAVLATDQSPEQVLAAAEAEMKRVREEMLRIAMPFYMKRTGASESDARDLNRVVSAVLGDISQRHATPDTYFSDAKRDLEEATQFVRAKDLLTLPARSNLQVIETPVFMRGIYSVGGFNAAPALEPQLGAFYWITPIPKDWPAARIESKLREYNTYGLKLLTIHEAMPGHYVQLEYANDVQPPLRRIIRAVFGNGPYVEGWAVYATEAMLEAGYLDNSPELRLTFLKQQLRMIANTILDVRLQTMGMTDEQAMSLMLNDAFQEREEATGKLRRAKLSSTQLPTYYVGWRDWHRFRNRYREAKGGSFSLKAFHEDALKQGAVPLPVLSRLLAGRPL